MNKREAIQVMLDGKKVFNTNRTTSMIFYISKDGDIRDCKYNLGHAHTFYSNYDNHSWEIFQEPKKLVKFYIYLDKNGRNTKSLYSDCGQYRFDRNNMKATCCDFRNIRNWIKIQGAFIEVEV